MFYSTEITLVNVEREPPGSEGTLGSGELGGRRQVKAGGRSVASFQFTNVRQDTPVDAHRDTIEGDEEDTPKGNEDTRQGGLTDTFKSRLQDTHTLDGEDTPEDDNQDTFDGVPQDTTEGDQSDTQKDLFTSPFIVYKDPRFESATSIHNATNWKLNLELHMRRQTGTSSFSSNPLSRNEKFILKDPGSKPVRARTFSIVMPCNNTRMPCFYATVLHQRGCYSTSCTYTYNWRTADVLVFIPFK